jgi:hypothetical protein
MKKHYQPVLTPLYSIEYPSYNSYNSILLHSQKRYQRERKGIAKDGRTQTEMLRRAMRLHTLA